MKYRCKICGYIHEGEMPEDFTCPICSAPKSMFEKVEEENKEISFESNEEFVNDINKMAIEKQMIINAMGTDINTTSWKDILILGSALNPMPLLESEDVSLKTIIGKRAKRPLVADMPIFISHMSFGALSKEAKTALAIGSKNAKTVMSSGEGGVLKEELENSYKYIYEYVPNKYSLSDELLEKVDAVEIKISQGTKPGMGGHLPGLKVTEEVAKVRGKKQGEDIISPSRFSEINSKEDLKNLVEHLRKKSLGAPIGIKLAAGHIEEDLEYCLSAGVDFISIDGRGGATAASPKVVKNSTSIPTIYALYRARKYLDSKNSDVSLIITGGLRDSSDFAKALALGADAVSIATSALVAIGCKQYKVCHMGTCPMGIATQDETLRKNFDIEESSKRLTNYLEVVKEELKTFGRITSHKDIHELNVNDLVTTNSEISNNTNIKHV